VPPAALLPPVAPEPPVPPVVVPVPPIPVPPLPGCEPPLPVFPLAPVPPVPPVALSSEGADEHATENKSAVTEIRCFEYKGPPSAHRRG
jgi:hypothetical protein